MLYDDIGKVLLAFVAGWLAVVVLRRLPRFRGTYVSPKHPLPWHYHGICAIQAAAMAVAFPNPFYVRWALIASSVVLLLVAAWKFCKQRVQFTLRSVLLLTFVVASLCSASYYVPIAWVLVFLCLSAMEWSRLEEGRRLALAPSRERGEEANGR